MAVVPIEHDWADGPGFELKEVAIFIPASSQHTALVPVKQASKQYGLNIGTILETKEFWTLILLNNLMTIFAMI